MLSSRIDMASAGAVIFLSYRRSDTAGHAKNLYDRLARWFDIQEGVHRTFAP